MKAIIVYLLILGTSAKAATGEKVFKPFKVACSVYTKGVTGELEPPSPGAIVVTLAGKGSSSQGEKLIRKVGDFEFWVKTGETLFDDKSVELFTYNAQIRNPKLKLKASASSSDDLAPDPKTSKKVIKTSSVELNYKEMVLSMHCLHRPSENMSEQLRLTH